MSPSWTTDTTRSPDCSGGRRRRFFVEMTKDNVNKLEQRVVHAAETALAERQFVTPIDVLVGVFITVTLELCGIHSLSFAVGSYLPIATTAPIFVGGLARPCA